ncbi:hypothetical protein NOR_02473 [Metarhizium rileyi]|uniref:Uncharacterized protein n=1 Tax=Metarhizium rileyi (strain RCEF 4871) TaxID=1649241 RepID=A0A167GML9_METRR|nr:hypothetical protein NOR_02473 [Metarhizium rileyi RCEF 4871]
MLGGRVRRLVSRCRKSNQTTPACRGGLVTYSDWSAKWELTPTREAAKATYGRGVLIRVHNVAEKAGGVGIVTWWSSVAEWYAMLLTFRVKLKEGASEVALNDCMWPMTPNPGHPSTKPPRHQDTTKLNAMGASGAAHSRQEPSLRSFSSAP